MIIRAIVFLLAVVFALPAMADCTTPSGFKRIGGAYWRMANVGFPTAPGFERLPSTVPTDIPQGIKDLARFSTGRAAHIRTDASELHLCYENAHGNSSTNRWVQNGMRGGDVYYRSYGTTEWHWLTTVPATDPDDFEITYDMGSSADREFLIYFPSYARLTLLRIEVPTNATIAAGPAPNEDPIVVLGTSITQGANSSRPGMVYVAQLGRMMDRDAINLGFDASCNLYGGFATLLAQIPASAYVIDCFQNMSLSSINSLMYDFGDDLASAVSPVPVIFVEQAYDQRGFGPDDNRTAETAAAYSIYQSLAAVHSNVFWIDTDGMLGADHLATSEGIHPTDLGHYRMAVFLASAIDAILAPYRMAVFLASAIDAILSL